MKGSIKIVAVVFIIAVLIPLVVEGIKRPLPEKWHGRIGAVTCLVISIVVCLLAKADIFLAFGVVLQGNIGTIAGQVLTGACCSMGANSIYDKFKEILSYRHKVTEDLNSKLEVAE